MLAADGSVAAVVALVFPTGWDTSLDIQGKAAIAVGDDPVL